MAEDKQDGQGEEEDGDEKSIDGEEKMKGEEDEPMLDETAEEEKPEEEEEENQGPEARKEKEQATPSGPNPKVCFILPEECEIRFISNGDDHIHNYTSDIRAIQFELVMKMGLCFCVIFTFVSLPEGGGGGGGC